MMGYVKNNENGDICRTCGGKCCKQCGGHYSPDDFDEITVEALKERIDRGNISIDWWEGDVVAGDLYRTLYLRARHVGADEIDPSWGGTCIHLKNNGCELTFEDRPLACRDLIPSREKCIGSYSKEDCCRDWYKYQYILNELVMHYGDKQPESLVSAIYGYAGGY
jgi:Fe-S-cluster containining protein